MKTPEQQRATARRRRSVPRGFTLVELVVSMTIMTILMGAMTSVIVVASHAIPNGQGPLEKKTQAADIVDEIVVDLVYATSIKEGTGSAVTFTVADRGHGAAGPEIIRYEWSGMPGDPLTRQYNSGTVTTVCDDVQDFSLVFSLQATRLQGLPRVLLVADDANNPTAREEARRTRIESWGFSVQLISASATDAAFATAVTTSDAIYISEGISSGDIGTRLRYAPVGVLSENPSLNSKIGFSQAPSLPYLDTIDVTNNTHEITSTFAAGSLALCSSMQGLYKSEGTLAGGAQVLAVSPLDGHPFLMVIEAGDALYGGDGAPARRVKLPWGSGSFNFDSLTKDGLTLMKRAIVWAAAPVGVASVRITLQLRSDPGGRVETQVPLLNVPEAP